MSRPILRVLNASDPTVLENVGEQEVDHFGLHRGEKNGNEVLCKRFGLRPGQICYYKTPASGHTKQDAHAPTMRIHTAAPHATPAFALQAPLRETRGHGDGKGQLASSCVSYQTAVARCTRGARDGPQGAARRGGVDLVHAQDAAERALERIGARTSRSRSSRHGLRSAVQCAVSSCDLGTLERWGRHA